MTSLPLANGPSGGAAPTGPGVAPTGSASGASGLVWEIQKLHELYTKGAVTSDGFAAAKRVLWAL